MDWEWIENGSVTSPEGFLASGVACSIKTTGNKDLALIVSETPCVAAATFTTNKVKAAPVLVSKENLKPRKAMVRAIVVNSGNANCCTGAKGIEDARKMCEETGRALEIPAHQVLVASTGIIGRTLPMDRIISGIRQATQLLSRNGGQDAAEAILTTDSFPKSRALRFAVGGSEVRIGGIAKGAGMIAPQMATMLAFLTTDARVEKTALQQALRYAVDRSFNSIAVDGDTSTNDTVFLLANWQGGGPTISLDSPHFPVFQSVLTTLCQELSQLIVRDGEGASKFVEIRVKGAESDKDARAVALTVANSVLVKTALFGNDPNWGRIAAAVGRAPAKVRLESLTIQVGDFLCLDKGEPVPFDEGRVHHWLKENRDIFLVIDLGIGSGKWSVWTCDLTVDYVRFNAEYTT
ncbi:MAG: bifunctional glutamate N-acetyltransferase/amino-acid acetyltransferase ArgJ [Armatimonadetes bacterium]|nr:bifunctional glutamate N-acetyltransferase/amino-acid acetyltransferase ArgJ [Armatimonadota bacterium]MDW8121121.1 bifunctional glutamate N-acetyltransferase/amino-acid acetyltransferase ArgJ [Armatimonadota bacterium]